jgi:arsenite methyltransferase
MKAEDIKSVIREKYGEIANQSKEVNKSSCCGSTDCFSITVTARKK